MQPTVPGLAGCGEIRPPRRAELACVYILDGDCIGNLDLQLAEVHRHIFEVDLRVDQGLQQRRGRVRGAVDDTLAGGMPAAGRAQAAGAVQGNVVADAPQDHANMP